MAFLERGDPTFSDAPPRGYGLAGLGDSRISLVHLLPAEDQARLAAQQAARQAAQQAAAAAEQARVVSYSLCDAVARAAAAKKAQAEGGCVDIAVCGNDGRHSGPVSRQCFDDPRVKKAVVNQIKADEIEAGCLERMKEMATAPDANSEANVAAVVSEAVALTSEIDEFAAQVAADDADLAALARARDKLDGMRDAARVRLGRAKR